MSFLKIYHATMLHPTLESVSLSIHDAMMGNMLVCRGRRGGQSGLALVSPGRKEGGRKGGRMLGALCWNFLVAAATGFLPLGRFAHKF